MGPADPVIRIAAGFAFIAGATWILLGPLFDAPTPGVGLLAAAAASYVLGFLFVGLGSRAAISGGPTDRPPAPKDDQTMDWLDGH